jgi:hypothetical protein
MLGRLCRPLWTAFGGRFARNSSKWDDPRAKLLDGEAWEQARPAGLASLGLPGEAGEHLAARTALLVYARPNPKYFGRRGGATWLNMINDQAAGLGGKAVAGTPRDCLYVLDDLYDRDGQASGDDRRRHRELLRHRLRPAHARRLPYAPQLADLPDQKMWRIDRTADYGAFQDAARSRVDLARIARHWEDILRITGAVRAYDVIRMLSRDGRPTPLGDAIAHCGRIAKTPHILRLADEPGYRRQIKVRPTSTKAGTHSPGRSSTAAPGSPASATRTAWRTRLARSDLTGVSRSHRTSSSRRLRAPTVDRSPGHTGLRTEGPVEVAGPATGLKRLLAVDKTALPSWARQEPGRPPPAPGVGRRA